MKKLIFLFLFVTSLSMAQVPSLWRVVHGDTLYPAPGLILKMNYLTFDPTFYNTFIGQGAGNFTTTGADNTGIGYLSLFSNTTGYSNTANGFQSLYSNTTGNSNTANGYNSLFSNTTGYYNTANGLQSLYSNTTGYYNTANGINSLYSNTTGTYNTANGVNAGRYIADGTTGRTTGDNGIYLGYNSKASANGTNNEIVIGYNAIGAGSNTVTLGNTRVTGTLLNGNVGIGTTTFLRSAKLYNYGVTMSKDTIWCGNNTTYSYFKPGDALLTVSSDSTIKNNIQPFSVDLSKFSTVTPRTYTFKEDNFYEYQTVQDSLNEAKTDSIAQANDTTNIKVLAGMRNNMKVAPTVLAVGDVKNLEQAQSQAAVLHTGFLAQEFNSQLLGDNNSTEVDYNKVIAIMWLKIQELEKRVAVLEAKK